jgi:hypothetical protein
MKTDKYSIGHRKKKLKEVRRRLESSQINAVRELLPDSTIKGLGADVLRSKTEEGIYKELYARVIAGNLIHWLILKQKFPPKKATNPYSTEG